MINLYKVHEINQTRFYKVPKELIENPTYNKSLNSDAKLLYAMLLDRMELSRKNNWINENNEIYLLYTREKLAEDLGVCRNTIIKACKLLNQMELIKEVKQGLGKPNIIYIGKIKYLETIDNTQKSKICTSGSPDITLQEVNNLNTNETDCIETDSIETDYKDNGALSGDKCSVLFSNLDIIRAMKTYMTDLYVQKTGHKHPNLKYNQYKKVYENISTFCDEWGTEYDSLIDMMCQFLNSDISTDYNINHFATEGIMLNRMYEVAY